MTISAEQCIEAADLLAEREELVIERGRMVQATKCKIAYAVPCKGAADYVHYVDTREFEVTAAIRKLITASHDARIAEIDKHLSSLGVEPPTATEAA